MNKRPLPWPCIWRERWKCYQKRKKPSSLRCDYKERDIPQSQMNCRRMFQPWESTASEIIWPTVISRTVLFVFSVGQRSPNREKADERYSAQKNAAVLFAVQPVNTKKPFIIISVNGVVRNSIRSGTRIKNTAPRAVIMNKARLKRKNNNQIGYKYNQLRATEIQ